VQRVASEVPVLAGGAGIAAAGAVVLIGAAVRRRTGPYLPAGHALAGPQNADPLPAVLRRGLAGLTVPVRPGPHGELFLGAGLPRPGRTLRRLVLNPLLARVRARGGRLTRDQRVPFRLVVEFAGPYRDADSLLRAYRILDRQLRDHGPLLSGYDDGRLVAGAVTVAVTGIVDVRELLAGQRRRYVFAEGSFDDLETPAVLAPMISAAWVSRFGWDGRDLIPAEERHLLHALVAQAHQNGRTVRFSGLPAGSPRARRAVWAELLSAGVDVIADGDQPGLTRFLRGHPAHTVPAVQVSEPRRRPPSPRPRTNPTKQASQVNGT
jgi:hypothetical protein